MVAYAADSLQVTIPVHLVPLVVEEFGGGEVVEY